MSTMKIQIALCDDQLQTIDQLEHYLTKYFDGHGPAFQIHKFSAPSDLFEYMGRAVVNIVFMDLEYGSEKEDGVLWTKRIHDAFPGTLVMILTAYEQRYKEGYWARAFRFMTKPPIWKEFEENMDDCLGELGGLRSIRIRQKSTDLQIAVKDILYIEAYVGESAIHTRDKVYNSDESLLQWEERLLDNHFFRIHKSYLVNMSHVTDILSNQHEVILDQTVRLPVSRRKWTEFQSSFMRYDVSKNL